MLVYPSSVDCPGSTLPTVPGAGIFDGEVGDGISVGEDGAVGLLNGSAGMSISQSKFRLSFFHFCFFAGPWESSMLLLPSSWYASPASGRTSQSTGGVTCKGSIILLLIPPANYIRCIAYLVMIF